MNVIIEQSRRQATGPEGVNFSRGFQDSVVSYGGITYFYPIRSTLLIVYQSCHPIKFYVPVFEVRLNLEIQCQDMCSTNLKPLEVTGTGTVQYFDFTVKVKCLKL